MKRTTARSQRRKAPRTPRPIPTAKISAHSKAPKKTAPKQKPAAAKKPVAAKKKFPSTIKVTPELRQRALRVIDGLKQAYPDARCELDFTNALEALVSTILAAQCTDARVNMVTPSLFKKYRTPQDYLNTPDKALQDEIRTTGFFNNKTKSIKNAARMLIEQFGGEMPRTMEELLKLPGVGRKTANVILANIHGIPGVVVDTHMLRLSRRLGFSVQTDANKVERDMMEIFPESEWIALSRLIPWHGRRCCTARNPNCEECPVADDCPKLIE
jgi:endonuclease-3